MNKSKTRFILALMVVVCVIITSLAVPVSATQEAEILDSLPVFDENYIPSSMINYTIDEKIFCELRDDVVEIIVSDETVEIEATLYSEYIDVFGKLENGKYIDITDEVRCEFEDESMAMWVFGRIIGDKVGTTTAVLSYNGLSKEITVTVNKQTVLNFSTRISKAATEENAVTDADMISDTNNICYWHYLSWRCSFADSQLHLL